MDQTGFRNIDIESGTPEEMAWKAFGFYIRRQMGMGRAVSIPHFGIFTFSAPEVTLNGVTNPIQRDKQLRRPVFLVSQDFANGSHLKTGIYIDNHIRAYKVQTSGTILQTKINWTEIAQYANLNKDSAQFSIQRVIRLIADKCRNSQNFDIQIPEVGNLRVRNNITAVEFQGSFVGSTTWIPQRPLSERKKFGQVEAIKSNKALSMSQTFASNFGTLKSTMNKSRSQLRETYYDPNFRPETSSVALFGFNEALTTYKQKSESALEKLRKYLRVSNKNIEQEFKKQDCFNYGILTNLQFKQAMRNLNFAFASSEIDELMHLCTFQGNFQWKFFINMIRMREADYEYIIDHFQTIENVSKLIYTYMLSPKDAFRMYDKDGLGILKQDQINKLIQQLYYLANEQCPSQAILQKIFDFIDKDHNQIIDLQEWMEVFGQLDYTPITSVPKSGLKIHVTKPTYIRANIPPLTAYLDNPFQKPQIKQFQTPQTQSHNYLVKRVNFNQNQHQPLLMRQSIYQMKDHKFPIDPPTMGQFEASKDFDKVLQAIARNRKILLEQFQIISQKQKLTYETTRKIIENVLKNAGVQVKEESWQMLIKFAEKEGIVDYKFLLESYKERTKRIDQHPIKPLRFDIVQ